MAMLQSPRQNPIHRVTPFAAAATLLLLSGGALAQADGGAKPAEPVRTILAFEHGDCASFLPSKKDAALLAALNLVPVRVAEIMATPGLGPDPGEVPEGIVELVTRTLTGPMRMAVTQQGFDERSRMPKLGMVISYSAKDQGDANSMMTRVENARAFVAQRGPSVNVQPSQRYPGMNAIVLPPGTLLYGPRQGKDGWRFEVMFGNVADPDGAMWDALPKGGGVKSVAARGVFDLAAATPVIEMFGGMASMWMPSGESIMQGLRDTGVIGDDAISIEAVCGFDGAGSVKTFTVHRAGRLAEKMGIVRTALTGAELSVLPADSVFASVSRIDPQGMWAKVKAQAGAAPEFERMQAELREVAGIDIETDLISALGGTSALCLSDTTGGNSLLSAVGFIEARDPAKLSATLDKLAEKGNAALDEMVRGGGPTPGTVRLSSWVSSEGATKGVKFMSLRCPGLPIPAEPTLAVADRWLIVGLSPQSCSAAAGHAMSVKGAAKGGLLTNPAFAASAGQSLVGATSVTFIDSASTMRDGYPVLQMLGAALTNFARSPSSASPREVAQVVPALGELKSGARPIVFVTTWSGDDMVMSVRGDESALVNIAGLLGTGDVAPMVFGGFLGAAAGHDAGRKVGHAQARWESGHDHDDHDNEPEMDDDEHGDGSHDADEAPEPITPRERRKTPM